MTFYLYEDSKGEYRWRLRAANGEIVAVSSEGYTYKSGAEHAINLVKKYAASASVIDAT